MKPSQAHDAINGALATHRVWHVAGLPNAPRMYASRPAVWAFDEADGPEAGRLALVFGDGERMRHPWISDAVVEPNGFVTVAVPPTSWPTLAGRMVLRPMTLALAQKLGYPDVEGLDESNPEHMAIFEGMFP